MIHHPSDPKIPGIGGTLENGDVVLLPPIEYLREGRDDQKAVLCWIFAEIPGQRVVKSLAVLLEL